MVRALTGTHRVSTGIDERQERPQVSNTRDPSGTAPASADALPPLHAPLLAALSKFERTSLERGEILFHGCRDSAPHIDLQSMRLLGTRKWLSADASYACDYGRAYGGDSGKGFIWICRLRESVPALAGSQYGLIESAPWQLHEFPWKLPNEFARYAQHILKTDSTVALLDHPHENGYHEVLLTLPESSVEVIRIFELPSDTAEAREFGARLNDEYRVAPE